ncbi:hypothetical protein KA005_62540 [bacterium]|nr:hypothetical protein [bacterium]
MNLVIGDKESIKARDKGCIEAWEKHFKDTLQKVVVCPYECSKDRCNGPEVMLLADCGIKWICRDQNTHCSSCGQDIERDPFWTDFKGKEIDYMWEHEEGPFNPNDIESIN